MIRPQLSFEDIRARLDRYLDIATEGARDPIRVWLRKLCEASGRLPLPVTDPAAFVELMLGDAISLSMSLEMLEPGTRVLQAGSLYGAPGLPLAFERDCVRLTIIETCDESVGFLNDVLNATNRTDIRIENCTLASVMGEWDVVVSPRPAPSVDPWLRMAARVVRPGGGVWLLTSNDPTSVPEWATRTDDVRMNVREPDGSFRRALRYDIVARPS